MAIGKTKRFEIFKRDGFTCQYCGQRPPQVILELDHIDPRAGGGSDDDINLITACFDCNRGKRDRKLGDVHPRPDADIEYLKVQQEIAEAQRYLSAKRTRDDVFGVVTQALQEVWEQCLTKEWVPSDKQWRTWLNYYSPEEIELAIKASVPAYMANRFGYDEEKAFFKLLKYVSTVMRNQKGGQ